MSELLENALLAGIFKHLRKFQYISLRKSFLYLSVIQTKIVCLEGHLEGSDTYILFRGGPSRSKLVWAPFPRFWLMTTVFFDILGSIDLALVFTRQILMRELGYTIKSI